MLIIRNSNSFLEKPRSLAQKIKDTPCNNRVPVFLFSKYNNLMYSSCKRLECDYVVGKEDIVA